MNALLILLLILLLFGTRAFGSDSAVATPVGRPIATVTAATPQAESGWAHPEWFADPAFVAEHLTDPSFKVIALMPEDDFSMGHIPGARQVDWPAFEIVETGDQQVESWRTDVEGILTSLGITPTDTVVVYDDGTFYAPRLWWVLHELGHADVRILDGGLAAWQDAGMEVEGGIPSPDFEPDAAEPYVGRPSEAAIATIDEVEAAVGQPGVALVDARTPGEYADGHIPGAVNIPFTDNALMDEGGRFKHPEELRAMYAEAGVPPDLMVIPYCATGVRSAATYFTLRALGYEDVSLFTGSWVEWSADPSREVATE